jgi:ATP-dependent DNA helicase RecQ
VVHLDLPDSLEAYFQESGRAGRDEKKAYATLLFDAADERVLREKHIADYPEIAVNIMFDDDGICEASTSI